MKSVKFGSVLDERASISDEVGMLLLFTAQVFSFPRNLPILSKRGHDRLGNYFCIIASLAARLHSGGGRLHTADSSSLQSVLDVLQPIC